MDMNSIKVGDVVHVRGKVMPRDHGTHNVNIGFLNDLGGRSQMLVSRNEILHVEPRPLQVGEKVRASGMTATIRALDANYAWLCFGETYGTYTLDQVVRA